MTSSNVERAGWITESRELPQVAAQARLSARALSTWQLVHLTRYGESRVEMQARSLQTRENYLSDQS
jgi:hypothetical protein